MLETSWLLTNSNNQFLLKIMAQLFKLHFPFFTTEDLAANSWLWLLIDPFELRSLTCAWRLESFSCSCINSKESIALLAGGPEMTSLLFYKVYKYCKFLLWLESLYHTHKNIFLSVKLYHLIVGPRYKQGHKNITNNTNSPCWKLWTKQPLIPSGGVLSQFEKLGGNKYLLAKKMLSHLRF